MAAFNRTINFASTEKAALSWLSSHSYDPSASLDYNIERITNQLVGPFAKIFFVTRGYGAWIRGGAEAQNAAFDKLVDFIVTYRRRHPNWGADGGNVEHVNFHALSPKNFENSRVPEGQTARRIRQVMQRRLFGIAVNSDGGSEDWQFVGADPFGSPDEGGAWTIDTCAGWLAEPAYDNADMRECGLVQPHASRATQPILARHQPDSAHYRASRSLTYDQYDDLDLQTASLLVTFCTQKRLGKRELPFFV